MMAWESDLHAYLVADTELIALVGTRIYWNRIPQTVATGVLSRVVLHEISGEPTYHQGGESTLTAVRVQITAFAAKRSTAKSIVEALRNLMSGYKGTMGSTTIMWSEREGGVVDLSSEPLDGSDAAVYGLAQDYTIHLRQAVPTG